MYAVPRRAAALASVAVAVALAATALVTPEAPAKADEPKPELKAAKAEEKGPAAGPAEPAKATTAAPAKITVTLDGKTMACSEQVAQPFLVRGSWFPKGNDADTVKAGRKMLEDAIKYRTQQYGYFEGFGNAKWNAHAPKHFAKGTSFMGMSVQVHEKIIPALKCVEAALKASGAGDEYKPRAMGGMRFHNTYKGVEVSNHVYGIAVDIEPDKNTCCGCVKPWNEHPLCKKKVKSVFERMVMPKSWVDTFERFGFYWLGHDVLVDTMHFEFLGEPDKILETP
jgi:hypothetical protein